MNDLIKDSVRLCNEILNRIIPYDNWVIVNIAQSEFAVFSYPSIQEIPTSYGYVHDNVPKFLTKEGVIEAGIEGRWIVKVTDIPLKYKVGVKDVITDVALKKKYFNKGNRCFFYSSYDYGRFSWGPKARGQMCVLINIDKLKLFVRKFSSLQPLFDFNSGTLNFLGKNVTISGEVEKNSLKLLLDKLNSIISKEEFYNIPRGLDNYSRLTKNNKSGVHDSLEKIFTKLKKTIESIPEFKKVFVFVQKDGFGIFLDQSKMTTPQNKIGNSPNK